MRRIVLATNNLGKLREFRELLGDQWELVPQAMFNVTPVEETGLTFVENAMLKARHAARSTGLPAIADDSGIEVDALGGEPGVHSARYAGPGATDTDNNHKLLARLADAGDSRRTARFRCCVVFLKGPADPAPLVAEGTWEGSIARSPAGAGGFGYDPIFIDAESGVTSALMSASEKNARSHRGKAVRALRSMLEKAPVT